MHFLLAGIFISLYLRGVFGRSPLEVSFSFLPARLIIAVLSLEFSAKLVIRFGVKPTSLSGLLLAALGLLLLARPPVEGKVLVEVIPATMVLAAGATIAFNPLLRKRSITDAAD